MDHMVIGFNPAGGGIQCLTDSGFIAQSLSLSLYYIIIDHQSLLPFVTDDWKDFLQSTNHKILFLETYFLFL